MGKKLIIKGADFSAVAIDGAIVNSLDTIAYENKSYREIFETRNMLGITPGFEDGSYSPLGLGAGTPTVTDSVADTGQYSLKAFGKTSQQVRTSNVYSTGSYFCAARIRCDRYTSGKLGIIINTTGAIVTETTEQNFTTQVNYVTVSANTNFYVGSALSANLDGYVDTPVIVDAGIFTNLPSVEEFTQLYETYVSMKKA